MIRVDVFASDGETAKAAIDGPRPNSSASALAETIDAYASWADEFAAFQWDADFTEYIETFTALVQDRRLPVLDAGCGAGRDVAAIVAGGLRCIGVDLSYQLLQSARERVPDAKASWLLSDIRSVPLKSQSIAGIWTNAALLHLEGAGQGDAIAEFRRLIVPRGPVFISTLAGHGWSSRMLASGHRRWFWGTDHEALGRVVSDSGFEVLSAATEAGVVRGSWVNILAVAG